MCISHDHKIAVMGPTNGAGEIKLIKNDVFLAKDTNIMN